MIGPALFEQPAPTYLALLARAAGRGGSSSAPGRPGAPRDRRGRRDGARGRRAHPAAFSTLATVVGGAFAGLAGATLVLAQVGTFAEKMTAGRGFVAIAIVVLGRWHPAGVAVAALLFGAATALQFLFQALGLDVPYQLFLMLPYLLTLLALAGSGGTGAAAGGAGDARCLVDARPGAAATRT